MRTISCLAWVCWHNGTSDHKDAEITVAADGPVADTVGPAWWYIFRKFWTMSGLAGAGSGL